MSAQPTWAARDSALIRQDGLGQLSIGQVLPRLRRSEVAFDRLVADEQGEPARVMGVVVGGQVVNVELRGGRIWRLTITAPGLRTREGVEVGSAVAEVAARSAVSSLLGPGAELILVPDDRCGLAFWTNVELSGAELQRTWDRAALLALPANLAIRAILVTGGCAPSKDAATTPIRGAGPANRR